MQSAQAAVHLRAGTEGEGARADAQQRRHAGTPAQGREARAGEQGSKSDAPSPSIQRRPRQPRCWCARCSEQQAGCRRREPTESRRGVIGGIEAVDGDSGRSSRVASAGVTADRRSGKRIFPRRSGCRCNKIAG